MVFQYIAEQPLQFYYFIRTKKIRMSGFIKIEIVFLGHQFLPGCLLSYPGPENTTAAWYNNHILFGGWFPGVQYLQTTSPGPLKALLFPGHCQDYVPIIFSSVPISDVTDILLPFLAIVIHFFK